MDEDRLLDPANLVTPYSATQKTDSLLDRKKSLCLCYMAPFNLTKLVRDRGMSSLTQG